MIDGSGDLNMVFVYVEVVLVLFFFVYMLKFVSWIEFGIDIVVMLFEGLWYVDDMELFIFWCDKFVWEWMFLFLVGDYVMRLMFVDVVEIVVCKVEKKKELFFVLLRVWLEMFVEG